MSPVKYAGGKRSLQAYIAVCLQIQCNPSSSSTTFTDNSIVFSFFYDCGIQSFSLERWQSIVISTAVCVSICPRAHLPNHTRDLCQLLVHVAYGRGSVLLRRGDKIPRGRGNFGSFFPNDNALYTIWDPYKTADRESVWDDDSGGP